mmetsp:Transcript_86245/g.172203  ORF Transcript_86245/g.172203 Transcript_86245/m.172203 type:complete len:103 (-) Transcript_86245:375-683(-)
MCRRYLSTIKHACLIWQEAPWHYDAGWVQAPPTLACLPYLARATWQETLWQETPSPRARVRDAPPGWPNQATRPPHACMSTFGLPNDNTSLRGVHLALSPPA